MDSSWSKGLIAAAFCAASGALAGCASPQARDFTGAWHPVNRYAVASERIPLHPAYVFEASPLDATLKGMLARWASDASLRLDYRLPYDLTLHEPVAALHSADLAEAIRMLDALFADQQIAVTLGDGSLIAAARARDSDAPQPEAPGAPAGPVAGTAPGGGIP